MLSKINNNVKCCNIGEWTMDSAATYEKRDPGRRYPVKHYQHTNFQVACEAEKSTLPHQVGTSFNFWVTNLCLKQDCLIFRQTQQN